MTFLIDTNVLSEATKRSPNPRVVRWLGETGRVATRNTRDFEGCGVPLLNPFES